MRSNKIFKLVLLSFLLSSCSFSRQSTLKSFLNYRYVLKDAGDIHGLDPSKGTVLNGTKGFTSYTKLFNKQNSYINFQCKGNNQNDFHCETTMCVTDLGGNMVFGDENYVFNTSVPYGESVEIIYDNKEDENKIGRIYVYTPYWVRWQFEYDVNNDGNKVLLTFEFWKQTYNDLPEWRN